MAVLEFFKSLFIPKKMQRFRHMSLIISICLFILSIYVFRFPVVKYYEKHVHEKVVENNIYYLQTIENIPTVSSALDEIVRDINGMECSIENSVLTCASLGVDKIKVDDNILGYITRNSSTGTWYYNNEDTEVNISSEVTDIPGVKAIDNGIAIDNVTDSAIFEDGLVADEAIDIIKLTVNNRGLLSINNTVYEDLITGDTLNIEISDNKLICNDIVTDVIVNNKCVIYFVPNTEVKYYEKDFQYMGEDGYQKNIKVIVDLDTTAFNYDEPLYVYSTDFEGDLQNEEYYYIFINSQAISYQAHLRNITDAAITHDDTELYSYVLVGYYAYEDFDFSTLTTATFGSQFLTLFESVYVSDYQTSFVIMAILYGVIFPFLISIMYFLMFKRQGKMKTFKEYYNIAAISNIVPVIVTFIILWFMPDMFYYLYIFVFAVWYLFTCYRINNSSEIV